MLIDPSKSFVVNKQDDDPLKMESIVQSSRGWRSSVKIIEKDDKIYVLSLNIVGKIFNSIANVIGHADSFIKWTAKLEGNILNHKEATQKIKELATNMLKNISIKEGQEEWNKNANKKDSHANGNILLRLFSSKDISDKELYDFFKTNNISPDKGWFITQEGNPTIEASKFSEVRGTTVQEFMKTQHLNELNENWQTNSKNHDHKANEKIIIDLISDSSISNFELYKFLKSKNINPEGGWFKNINGKPTSATAELYSKRGFNNPQDFFNYGDLTNLNISWNTNANDLVNGFINNKKILLELISNKNITDDKVLQFFKDVKIRPGGGWFQDSQIKESFQKVRPDLANEIDKLAGTAQVSQVKGVQQKLTDPIENLISINCHGAYSNETFELPPNVYILAPHPNGFDTPYVLESPPENKTFEEMIYKGKDGQIPTPSSGGWHVYKPGEQVHNLQLSPWSGHQDVNVEFESWKGKVPPKDAHSVKPSEGALVPKFAVVPARDSNGDKLSYGGNDKTKVKVFGATDLKKIMEELVKNRKDPNEPIVIAPFACNAGENNESVNCSSKETTSATALFS